MTIREIRRHLPALALVLGIALVLRLAWLAWVRPDPTDGRFDDTAWYRGAAHFFSLGAGYVNPYAGTPTAAWPPGYPVFLGAVFKAFGEGIVQTSLANLALALLTIAAAYAIGVAIFGRSTALVGAALLAVWPGQITFTTLTLSEPLFAFLFVTALLLILLVPRAVGWRGPLVIAFGVMTALAIYTRGQAAVLLPLALVAWGLAGYRWRSALVWSALAALVVAAMLAPWVARNQRELGSPVLLATNFGPNMWIGNHDGATGRMQFDGEPLPLPSREGRTQPEFEVDGDRLALRKALRYMATHPVREVQLAGAKVRALYESDATGLDWNSAYNSDAFYGANTNGRLRGLTNVFWFGTLVFAGVGLITMRHRLGDLPGLLPLTVLAWTGVHVLFFGDSRFHYPVAFAFALLAARGIVVIAEAIRRPQPSLDSRYAAA